MQRLAEHAWRIDSLTTQETVGELAWMTRQHVGLDWTRQLWIDGDGVVAWAWIKPPGARLFWEVDPRGSELMDEVLDWFEREAAERPLQTAVRARNAAAIEALERYGFAHDSEAPWIRWNARDLDEIEEPRVPSGYRLSTMAETPDLAARSPPTLSAGWTRRTLPEFSNLSGPTPTAGAAAWHGQRACPRYAASGGRAPRVASSGRVATTATPFPGSSTSRSAFVS